MRPSDSFASIASSALERRGDASPRSHHSQNAPVPPPPLGFQAVAEAVEVTSLLVRLVDGLVEALANTSEAEACTCLVDGLTGLAAALDRIVLLLPRDPVQQRLVANLLSVKTKTSEDESPVISAEEVQTGIDAALLLLLDFRAAVTDVSKEELAEIIEIGLPLLRTAARTLQRSARRMHRRALQFSSVHRSTVLIEDLDAPVPNVFNIPSDGEVPRSVCVTICRKKRRYLWQPLWPRLRSAIHDWSEGPWVPDAASKACRTALDRPLQAALVLAFAGPATVVGVTWVMPPVLLADTALQRLYTWKGSDTIDDAIDGVVQTTRVGFLSTRLLVRHSWRLASRQAKRWLNGRTPTRAALDVFQQWYEDPVGCARVSLSVASNVGTKVLRGARQVQKEWQSRSQAPQPTDQPQAARRPSQTDSGRSAAA
mmetsp:Transcript_15831/g.28863  ORF Transcript_15831/g.28863 Transcript_15831/m.28863 type:complete len:427 (-) Transcript_15831:63-1343(-)